MSVPVTTIPASILPLHPEVAVCPEIVSTVTVLLFVTAPLTNAVLVWVAPVAALTPVKVKEELSDRV